MLLNTGPYDNTNTVVFAGRYIFEADIPFEEAATFLEQRKHLDMVQNSTRHLF